MTGAALLTAGNLDHVLVIGAETLSRIVDPHDRGTCILFGDAAAGGRARAVARRRPGPPRLGPRLRRLGDRPARDPRRAGAGCPPTPETIAEGLQYIKMQGQEVFRRAVRAVVESAGHRARAGRRHARPTSTGSSPTRRTPASSKPPRTASGSRARRRSSTSTATATRRPRRSRSRSPRPPTTVASRDGDLVLMSGFGAGMTWGSRRPALGTGLTDGASVPGRVAFVTGASQGIGRAIAVELAAPGPPGRVRLRQRRRRRRGDAADHRGRGRRGARRLRRRRRRRRRRRGLQRDRGGLGPVEILVNNAGVTRDGLIARMTDDQWDAVLDTNLGGAFHTIRRASPKMMRARFGPHRQRLVGERPDRRPRPGQLLGRQGRPPRAHPGGGPGAGPPGRSPATSWPPGLS